MNFRTTVVVASLVVWVSFCAFAGASDNHPAKPGPKDRCSTCGMLVAKYPAWIATIVLSDGSCTYFDGPKDLFRFLASDGAQVEDSAEIWVTDYYTAKPIPAREAVFVLGSDVLGPMGKELVPFVSVELAEEFRKDHGGESPLAFDRIDASVLKALE